MSGRILLGLLITLSIVAGYPYAGFVLSRILGTAPVVMIEHDGTARTLVIGPDAPRPPWLPMMPSALLITAGHWVPGPAQGPTGDVELLSHASVDAIKSYYLEGLRRAGFRATDVGIAPLAPPVAAMLGLAGTIHGWRADTSIEVTVQIGTLSGLILPSRTIQVHWQQVDRPRWDVQAGPSDPAAARSVPALATGAAA